MLFVVNSLENHHHGAAIELHPIGTYYRTMDFLPFQRTAMNYSMDLLRLSDYNTGYELGVVWSHRTIRNE
ncbi:hypothetical protein M0802_007165 [Mischocyttarus mexicanus]|nr:hypothetical protein M0802_007165 [Mischocyttarus mexicanus]